MPRALRPLTSAVLGALGLALLAACHPGQRPPPKKPESPPAQPPVAVAASDFPKEAARLLVAAPKKPATNALLVGVVRAQLTRAAALFEAGQADEGFKAVEGAFYLVHLGQFRSSMLTGAVPALSPAAREAARRGDEGRAQLLYEHLRDELPPGPARDDVTGHLEALESWLAGSKHRPLMVRLGDAQRVATSRATLDPERAALTEAEKKTLDWLQQALALQSSEAAAGRLERSEAMEAYRALRAGAASIIALHLRHGDAAGGLSKLREKQLDHVVPGSLRDRLERAATRDDPQAWADLHRLFSQAAESADQDVSIDGDLSRAAAFGAAWRLYRRAPMNPTAVSPLAEHLADHGMADVATRIVAAAFKKQPDAAQLSWALTLAYNGIVEAMDAQQLAYARRIHQEAAPLLTLASKAPLLGQVRPSAAQIHYVLGLFETRSGQLEAGRDHLQKSAGVEPAQTTLELLAAIHLQQREYDAGRKALGKATRLARKQGDAFAEARALVFLHELERHANQPDAAKAAATTALERLLDARKTTPAGPELSRIERLLARVLSLFGEQDAARSALERAFDASRSDVQQLAATVQAAARAGLTSGSVATAREAVREALEAQLPDEDLVYAALWLKLTEQRAGQPSDGTVAEALASVEARRGWVGRLRAWARGALDDAALQAAASSTAEKTEATFYVAMAKSTTREVPAAVAEVARSPAIQLVEVHIARDLVARSKGAPPTLPEAIALP